MKPTTAQQHNNSTGAVEHPGNIGPADVHPIRRLRTETLNNAFASRIHGSFRNPNWTPGLQMTLYTPSTKDANTQHFHPLTDSNFCRDMP